MFAQQTVQPIARARAIVRRTRGRAHGPIRERALRQPVRHA